MKYLFTILLLASSAHAESLYVCSTPYLPTKLARSEWECKNRENLRVEFRRFVRAEMLKSWRLDTAIGRSVQSLGSRTKEALKAISCEWRELKSICTDISCQGGLSSSNGGELP